MATQKRFVSEQERNFKQVGAALRKQGVQFRLNVVECCRGCITDEKLNLKSEDQPYGFTYGGQGQRITWNSKGEMIYASSLNKSRRSFYYRSASESKVHTLYINHGNGSAEKIVEEFRKAGFDAEWDGSEWSTVQINL